MNSTTKMLLMNREKDKNRRQQNNDWPEDRFRDDHGREHYENGRYAPMSNMNSSRYPDNTYTTPRNEIYPWIEGNYSSGGNSYSPQYKESYAPERHPIGFALNSHMSAPSSTEMPNYNHDEMSHRSGKSEYGYAESEGYMPFTKDMAEMWMKGATNEDGSHGPHWTMEQTKQLQAQKNISCDPIEFWAAMNMIYSDYYKVAKKHGIGSSIDFYADMAKAFIDDKDARSDKMGRYFAYIVQH